jgi:hypothetical protein
MGVAGPTRPSCPRRPCCDGRCSCPAAQVARRAAVVNNLSSTLSLFNTLTECLSDEFASVVSVQDVVMGELFARLRAVQGYLFLGTGAAFAETQSLEVSGPVWGGGGSPARLPRHPPTRVGGLRWVWAGVTGEAPRLHLPEGHGAV